VFVQGTDELQAESHLSESIAVLQLLCNLKLLQMTSEVIMQNAVQSSVYERVEVLITASQTLPTYSGMYTDHV
jgi:hypothetical protein